MVSQAKNLRLFLILTNLISKMLKIYAVINKERLKRRDYLNVERILLINS